MTKNNFYIYGLFHERPKNNFIPKLFYIGRGSGRRMKSHFHKSKLNSKSPINPHKNNLIKKCKRNNWKCYPKKLYENLTLNEVIELEQFILNHEQVFDSLTNLNQNASGGSGIIGEDCNYSKLTNEEVQHIKWLLQNTDKLQYKIANYYNISKQVLSDIKHNRSWKHINSKKPKEVPNISSLGRNQISKQTKSEIKWLLQNTQLPQKKIAAKYNISNGPVSEIQSNSENFNHIEPSKPDSIPQGEKKTQFLTDQEVSKIKWLAQNTRYTQKSIGSKYGVSGQTVSEIKNEKIHTKIRPKKPNNTQNLKKSNYFGEKTAGQIKWLLKNTNLTQSEIGSLFNINRKTVSSINCEKTYKNTKLKKPDDKILEKVGK